MGQYSRDLEDTSVIWYEAGVKGTLRVHVLFSPVRPLLKPAQEAPSFSVLESLRSHDLAASGCVYSGNVRVDVRDHKVDGWPIHSKLAARVAFRQSKVERIELVPDAPISFIVVKEHTKGDDPRQAGHVRLPIFGATSLHGAGRRVGRSRSMPAEGEREMQVKLSSSEAKITPGRNGQLRMRNTKACLAPTPSARKLLYNNAHENAEVRMAKSDGEEGTDTKVSRLLLF